MSDLKELKETMDKTFAELGKAKESLEKKKNKLSIENEVHERLSKERKKRMSKSSRQIRLEVEIEKLEQEIDDLNKKFINIRINYSIAMKII